MTDPHQPLFPSSDAGFGAAPGPVGYPQIGAVAAPSESGGARRVTTARQIPQSWIIAGAAVLAVVAVIVGVVVLIGSSDSEQASKPSQIDATPSVSVDSSTINSPSGSDAARTTPMQSVPPPLVQAPDTYGEACGAGFNVSGQSGWATNSGRGSAETSCSFARSVLLAYWNQFGAPSTDRRTVTAAGRVPCPSTGGRCAGDDFVMECAVFGNDPWITCTGGRNARVYIY